MNPSFSYASKHGSSIDLRMLEACFKQCLEHASSIREYRQSPHHPRRAFALTLMFSGPESSNLVVIQCRGCHENIPAPVEGMPAQPTAARCPLWHEHRRSLKMFFGQLSRLMIRKPVRTADGRVG